MCALLFRHQPFRLEYHHEARELWKILMNRLDAKRFADERVFDAGVLLDAKCWHAAYYIVGYAVECGLKACVLKYIENTGIVFQDKRFFEACFTHDIEKLVRAANLEAIRGLDVQSNPLRAEYWEIVKEWSVDVRYQEKSEIAARRLFLAITDATNGVLPWIKTQW